jgi:outer membrane protein OmpA-like peptidoglycan-associated protein
MRRAMRVIIPVALLSFLGLVTLASQGVLKLPQFDLASLVRSPEPESNSASEATPSGTRINSPLSAVLSPSMAPGAGNAAPTASPGALVDAPDALRIEFARIDAEGVSVLGGRAPAGSRVSIIANGEVLTVVTASDDGQWSAIITRAFAAGPLGLSITSDAPRLSGIQSPVVTLDVPTGSGRVELAAASPSARPILPPRSPAGDSRAVNEFAAVVERARASGGRNDGGTGRESPALPLPITFVTGSAEMTPEGLRAAGLLVEYVRIMRPGSITLSGHADERGSDEFNLELSRHRLAAIETFLRKNDYAGRFSMLAKGKSEPYVGIDRKSAAIDQVYQADRRVELRLAE